MKKISICLGILFTCFVVQAQDDFDLFLQSIVTNNLALKAQNSNTEAQQLENQRGLTPSGPEIQGGYLWGSPSSIGNRRDFSVSQEIDFPTVYHHQNKLAELRNRQADLNLEQFQLELEQEAAALWVEAVNLNRRIAVQQERYELAARLASAYDDRLAAGDANRIDRNKAALNALQAEKQLSQLQQEKELYRVTLSNMNGNETLAIENTEYIPVHLPESFDLWSTQIIDANPQYQWYMAQNSVAERELKLNKSRNLPKISGGYMSEDVVGEKFQGVTLGVSIPLWENKNSVKAARQRAEASQLANESFQAQYRNELYRIYRNVTLAYERVKGYREEIENMNQKELLDEALQSGQISLVEYLVELQYNYEAIDQLLDAERDLQLAWMQVKILDRN